MRMKQKRLLYQVHLLDKMIVREFVKSNKEFLFHDPSPSQMIIIEYILKHQNEEIYQKDLENVLHLRRATVSGVLQTMEKNNLITRTISSKDVRCKKIVLNDKSKELFDKGKENFIKLENIVSEGLTVEEINLFNKIILKMQNNIINYVQKK